MKLFSFDIFDTCLVRTCGYPYHVFDLLAYRILGDNDDVSHYVEFARIRREAEVSARLCLGKEEITLNDIYSFCNFSGLTTIENRAIAFEEMQLEKELLSPVKKIQEKISFLHNKGISVAFVSDMYLPESFILEILSLNGFWKEGDALFLSSSLDKTKYTGNLYKCVANSIKKIGIGQWHHYGDNIYSDFVMSLKNGVVPHLVKHPYLKGELRLLENELSSFFCVKHIMAGISRAIRLTQSTVDKPFEFSIRYIAPLYVSFVWGILKDADRRGISKLFFLARDGYLLYRIAQKQIKYFPNIKIEYVFLSRKVLYFPGIEELNSDSFLSILHLRGGESLRTIFDKVGIDVEKAPVIDCWDFDKSLSLIESESILRIAFESVEFAGYINKVKKEQLTILVAYLEQVGLATNAAFSAIVDLRGTRKSHLIINQILESSNYRPVFGYYLEVMKNRVAWSQSEDYFALLFEDRYRLNSNLSYIGEINGLLEQYFSIINQGRTEAYKQDVNGVIIPVFGIKENEQLANVVSTLHEKVTDLYVDMYLKNKLYLYNDQVLEMAIKELSKFARSPQWSYLQFLKTIYVSDGNYTYRPIVTFLTLKDFFYLFFCRKKLIQRFDWIRGTLIFSFPYLRKIIIIMLDNNIIKKLIQRIKKV